MNKANLYKEVISNAQETLKEKNLPEAVRISLEKTIERFEQKIDKETVHKKPVRLEWIQVAAELDTIQAQRKELQERENKLKHHLIELSDNQPKFYGNYAFAYSYRKGSIDYQAIPELAQVNLEQYRKADVKIWKLTKAE